LAPDEPEAKIFVVVFGLRPNDYEISDNSSYALNNGIEFTKRVLFSNNDWDEIPTESTSRLTDVHARLITCMYFALTTLATVGYGDYFPSSVAEKIVGSLI